MDTPRDGDARRPREPDDTEEHAASAVSPSDRRAMSAGADDAVEVASGEVRDSTDRAASQYRHRLLSSVFEKAPFFVAITRGPEHIFEMANPAYRMLVGERELVGRSVAEAFPEAEPQGFIRLLDRVFETGEPHTADEVPVVLEDAPGETRRHVLNFVYQPLFDADGRVSGLHVHGVDVTEQVEARAVLEEKEARFRAVLESALDAAYRRDLLTDRYDYMSPVIEQLVGFSAEEMEAMSTEDVLSRVHRDDLDKLTASIERSTATGRGMVEYRFAGKDGRYRWLADQFTVHTDAQGRARYRSGVVRDITERMQIEEALRQSEERFRNLADNIAQLAWMADENGRIFWYNKRWFEYTGTTFAEVEGWGWQKVHHPDHVERVVESISESIETGEPWEDTFPLRGKDGTYRWFLSRAQPIRDQSGAVVRWFGTNTDVTERLELEHSLEVLTRTLEEQVSQRTRQVRELAARVTMAEQEERRRISQILHDDLQQLLYAIEMKMSMIRADLQETEQARLAESVDRARSLVDRAVSMTRQLTVDLSPPILQHEGLADALEWLQRQMGELHGLEVSIEAAHNFYIAREDLRVLLFQTVRELLFNVKKHAGVDKATVRLTEEDGHVVIHVIDEGCGFEGEEVQAHEVSGGGFGLFHARERLDLLGGRLVIHARPGEGTHAEVHAPAQLGTAG